MGTRVVNDHADTPHHHYLLGHTENELRRLDVQGDLYREATVRAFRDAGIRAGMRVLDIGCGSGDVSLTVGDLVGPEGRVVGIDRGKDAVARARSKAEARGLTHVAFEVTEIADYRTDTPFDALVGRFVLMHQPDPASALAAAARAVRPGGSVVMIESFMRLLEEGGHSEPHSPLYDEIVRFKCDVVRGAGADLGAGGRLRSTFVAAHLPPPKCRLEAPVEGGPDSRYYEYVEWSVRSMLPEAGRLGLDAFSATNVEGMADRLRDEVLSLGSSLIAWPIVVATTTV